MTRVRIEIEPGGGILPTLARPTKIELHGYNTAEALASAVNAALAASGVDRAKFAALLDLPGPDPGVGRGSGATLLRTAGRTGPAGSSGARAEARKQSSAGAPRPGASADLYAKRLTDVELPEGPAPGAM